jgi:hypothetical protein
MRAFNHVLTGRVKRGTRIAGEDCGVSVVMWVLGMALAVGLGVAVGGSFVQERGRKVLPVVLVVTISSGILIGWALNGELDAITASSRQ